MRTNVSRGFVLGLGIFLLLCGCGAQPQEDHPAVEILTALTGDEFDGRLYGTQGNQDAAEYIAGRLAALDLEPLTGDDMRVPFSSVLPVVEESSLVLQTPQGDQVLEAGVHYIPPLCGSSAVDGIITAAATPEGEPRSVLLQDNGRTVLTLWESDARMGGGVSVGAPEALSLTPAGMNIVYNAVGQRLTYTCRSSVGSVEMDNVMAVLPGKNREAAVVVGAHFDHMGRVGETVYRGALDNASGVAAVLAAAEALAGQQPETDVVFTFWNAEEMGLLGSEAGVEEIAARYGEYVYLNVDCIGGGSGGPVQITTENGAVPLCKLAGELMAGQGYSDLEVSQGSMSSDHVSFAACGAISFGQDIDRISNIIHHPADMPDALDTQGIVLFAQALSGMLSHSSQALVDAGSQMEFTPGLVWPEGDYQSMSPSGQRAYEDAIAGQLAIDEYVILRRGRAAVVVTSRQSRVFTSLEDAQALYPEFDAVEEVSGYRLAEIYIYDSPDTVAEGKRAPYNQVLTRTFTTDTISSVDLIYVSGDSALHYKEYYSAQPYMDMLLGLYTSAEPTQGMEEVWLCYDAELDAYSYVTQRDDTYITVTTETVSHNGTGEHATHASSNRAGGELEALFRATQSLGSMITLS